MCIYYLILKSTVGITLQRLDSEGQRFRSGSEITKQIMGRTVSKVERNGVGGAGGLQVTAAGGHVLEGMALSSILCSGLLSPAQTPS